MTLCCYLCSKALWEATVRACELIGSQPRAVIGQRLHNMTGVSLSLSHSLSLAHTHTPLTVGSDVTRGCGQVMRWQSGVSDGDI